MSSRPLQVVGSTCAEASGAPSAAAMAGAASSLNPQCLLLEGPQPSQPHPQAEEARSVQDPLLIPLKETAQAAPVAITPAAAEGPAAIVLGSSLPTACTSSSGSHSLPPCVLSTQHPLSKGCLLVLYITEEVAPGQLNPVQLHLLRVKRQLGSGGNASVWRVGWSRLSAKLLLDPTQPWLGAAISSVAAVTAFVNDPQHGQQQQLGDAVAAAVAAEDLADQEDDRALKVALRFIECPPLANGMRRTYAEYQCQLGYMLQEEHTIAQRSACPNVIDTFSSGQISCSSGEQLPCLLMELAPGGSVEQLIHSGPAGSAPQGLSYAEAKVVMRAVLRGLSKLHSTGVIHRDLKSGNVLLFGPLAARVAKLCDFGASKQMYSIDDLEETVMPGTLVYAAPEQVPNSYQDFRVDIFHAGLLLLEMRFALIPFWYLHTILNGVTVPQPLKYLQEINDTSSPYNQPNPQAPGWVVLQGDEKELLRYCLAPEVNFRPPTPVLFKKCSYLSGA